MNKRVILLIGLAPIYFFSWGQKTVETIKTGNEFFKQQQYDQAVNEYNKIPQTDPLNQTAKYNLATALYKQEKREEAKKLFEQIANEATDKELRSKANYNIGAILSKEKKLEESIEAYKNALRQNPADKEARENLQKALLELKKKEPPKKKDDKKKNQDQQQQKQPQSKLSRKEAEQRLKLLEQKEKEVQQRLQKAQSGGGQKKDW